MAGCDYRSCDVCGCKTFYDANLNYDAYANGASPSGIAYRVAGVPQYDSDEKCEKWGDRLDYLGDWAVICYDCAKTHKTVVVPI